MHVFISHSRINSSAAFRLCDELRKRGIETWLDMRDLEPGAEWDRAVSTAIQKAEGFVFLIGPPGPGDRWQTFEWQQVVEGEYYLDPSKPLIPVLIGVADLPGFLRTRQALTLEDTHASFERAAIKSSIHSRIRPLRWTKKRSSSAVGRGCRLSKVFGNIRNPLRKRTSSGLAFGLSNKSADV